MANRLRIFYECNQNIFLVQRQISNMDEVPVLYFYGYPLKAGQFKVKPFVVSLSNHERPFDKLRANG